MLEQFFGSQTRVALLRYFCLGLPRGEAAFFREIVRAINMQLNAVRRELQNLEEIGFVLSEDQGQKKYYKLNTGFNLLPEVQSLVEKSHLSSEKDILNSLARLPGVKYVALSGRFAGDDKFPVDLLIISDGLSAHTIQKSLQTYQKKTGSEINYTHLTLDEYAERRDVGDKFLFSLLMNPKQQVLLDNLKHI